ncbi:hypothetical protein PsYK624_039900 [Phanerochaete sordida]|uniref:Secreted protein n=1 Tax=Phanerochaete sordida TaxID=48140 RepID=A0A9P3G2M6_9APHY|nr:hypothetical protein PsYK624_039900 [Phanerochaete sordida]
MRKPVIHFTLCLCHPTLCLEYSGFPSTSFGLSALSALRACYQDLSIAYFDHVLPPRISNALRNDLGYAFSTRLRSENATSGPFISTPSLSDVAFTVALYTFPHPPPP